MDPQPYNKLLSVPSPSGIYTLTPSTMHEVVGPSHVIIAQQNILSSQTMHAWGVEGIAHKGDVHVL